MNKLCICVAAPAAAVALLGATGPAHGAVINPGFYALGNHPAFQAGPAGLQLDELYNVTADHDRFLFDFDHPQSQVILEVSPGILRVYGDVWGGRWNFNIFWNDQYRGLYSFNMSYTIGVQQVPGDDDLWVNGPNNINTGWITTPLGDTIPLYDERGNFGFSFRLGDENHDDGHLGFSGMSGWGWLNHGANPALHRPIGDFLFASRGLIPAPGSGALALLGVVLAASRRRR